ncbi:unnamed protein product, partial [Scytosiphon promiscuus]
QVLCLDASNIEAIASLAANHFYGADQPEVALRYYRRLLQMGTLLLLRRAVRHVAQVFRERAGGSVGRHRSRRVVQRRTRGDRYRRLRPSISGN